MDYWGGPKGMLAPPLKLLGGGPAPPPPPGPPSSYAYVLHGIDRVEKDKLFTMATYRTTRGHSMKLYKERPRLNVRANSFSNRVANTWNQLPESVIMAPALNAFKGRLNAHWKRHPPKSNPACYETGTTTGQRFQIPKASIQVR